MKKVYFSTTYLETKGKKQQQAVSYQILSMNQQGSQITEISYAT